MALFDSQRQQCLSESSSTFVTTISPPSPHAVLGGVPLFYRSLSAPSHILQFSEFDQEVFLNHTNHVIHNHHQQIHLGQNHSQLVDLPMLIKQEHQQLQEHHTMPLSPSTVQTPSHQRMLQLQQQQIHNIPPHPQPSQHSMFMHPMVSANYTHQSLKYQQQQPIHPFQMDMLPSSLQSSAPESFSNDSSCQQMQIQQQRQMLHPHQQLPHQQTPQRVQQQQFHSLQQMPPQPSQPQQQFFQPSPSPSQTQLTTASSTSLVSDLSSMSLSSQGRSLSISSTSTNPSTYSSSCSPISFYGGMTASSSSSCSSPNSFRPAQSMSRVPSLPFYYSNTELPPSQQQHHPFDVLSPAEEKTLCSAAYGFPRHGSVGSLYPLTHSHELLDSSSSSGHTMERMHSSFSSASASSAFSSSPPSTNSSLVGGVGGGDGGTAMAPSLSSTSISSNSSSSAVMTTGNRRRVSRRVSTTVLPGTNEGGASKGLSKQRRNSESPDSPIKPYFCTHLDCARQFKRNEHMKRHVKSVHTPEKPFPCPYPDCIKRFARSDNLHQHTRIHRHDKEKFPHLMFSTFNNIVSTSGGPTRRKMSSSVGL